MKSEIAEAFSQIAKEKNIDKEVISEILENTLMSIIKKKYGHADNFDIFVNLDKGEIEIYQNKIIVEKVEDEVREIDLESARKVAPDLEIGDEFVEIVDPASFGRRLIIAAKQNLNQKIREAEKDIQYEQYKNRIGELLVGDIRQVNRDEILLTYENVELILPRHEQIPNERYRRGDHLRVVVKEVKKTGRGLEIIVSRADPMYLIRLFELEVPEIYDGIIEIKSVAREPGERAKVAVISHDKRIDALGACVGMKGQRIQAISRELNNEKIDVINWHSDPGIFISRSLSPTKVSKVIVDQQKKKAIAVIPDEQVSLAIGRGGQNKRLAQKLTGYEIDIIKESEYNKIIEVETQAEKDLTPRLEELNGLSESIIRKLNKAGLITTKDIKKVGKKGLMKIPGIGEKTAQRIVELVESTEAETTN
ncbi:MAG: transcription termination factor NusA [Calditrichaeota bacterium]|nr:MAG: transcription termination factor NusA [Calditrichota bacterium]